MITCIINFQNYLEKNMKIGYVDTDSIIFKIENMKNEEYQNIQKNNPNVFGCKIGLNGR